jgi:hypothetical protein
LKQPPEGKTAPAPLLTNIIAGDRMEIVQGAAGNFDGDWKSWAGHPRCSIRPGCFLRASLIDRMEREIEWGDAPAPHPGAEERADLVAQEDDAVECVEAASELERYRG